MLKGRSDKLLIICNREDEKLIFVCVSCLNDIRRYKTRHVSSRRCSFASSSSYTVGRLVELALKTEQKFIAQFSINYSFWLFSRLSVCTQRNLHYTTLTFCCTVSLVSMCVCALNYLLLLVFSEEEERMKTNEQK